MGKERDNNISRGDVGAYVFFEYDNELVVAGGVGAVCAEDQITSVNGQIDRLLGADELPFSI